MWRGSLLLATLPLLLGGCAQREAPRAAVPAVASAAIPSPLSVISPVVRYTLPNGLVVLLNEDHRVPLVAVRVVYRVGAADPPGLAHLTEHLLFQGSRNVPGQMHWTYLDRAGASAVNATTRWDTTELFEVVPAAELELALWLEGERMAFGLEGLSQAAVDKEHRIVLLEHGERVDNVAGGRFDDLISGELFPRGHPYHVSVGGRAPPPPLAATLTAVANLAVYDRPADEYARLPEQIERLTADDVLRVSRTYLAPEKLRWFVVGDAQAVRASLMNVKRGPIRSIP